MAMTERVYRSLLLVLALVAGGCSSIPASGPQEAGLEDQILLTVKEPNAHALRLTGAPGKSYLKRRGYRGSPEIEQVLADIADQYSLTRLDGWRIRSLGVYCEVYPVADRNRLPGIIDRLTADPRVESVQPMNTFEVMATGYDDPYFELQSAAQTMEIASAHRFASGKGIKVAVVDTGIDDRHPDLRGQVYLSRNFVDTGRAVRSDMHGTAVAGVIASAANNQTGIVGMAPGVSVLGLKACWPLSARAVSARCSTFTLAKAIGFALDAGADVLNLSLTGPPDPLLTRLVEAAIRRGMIVVTAHPGSDEVGFPGSVRQVLIVESAEDMKPGYGSDTTSGADVYRLAAPGHDILTTAPDSGYEFLSGSSLAAAHVSGVAALLLEHSRDLSPQRVAEVLQASGNDRDDVKIVNACAALAQLIQSAECGTKLAGHH